MDYFDKLQRTMFEYPRSTLSVELEDGFFSTVLVDEATGDFIAAGSGLSLEDSVHEFFNDLAIWEENYR